MSSDTAENGITITGNPLPKLKKEKDVPIWLVAISILLPTAFAMLATSATNVAIPYIAGYFGSTVDEANWVITIYMIANAILIPLTGWLENYMGRVMFLKVFIIIFTVGSIICALAPSLNALVIGRLIQGIGGGPMMPISQAILISSFPYNKRGEAMALFALAVMVFSIMGPTFGGFIVDNSAWQWIYLINIPVGIFSVVLVHCNIVELKNRIKPDKVDYVGFGALVLWLMSMQIVLDKGQQFNWFDTTWICWLTGICIFSFVLFYVWELEYKYPVIDIRVFKDRNFLFGTIASSFINVMIYSTLLLVPMFVQSLLGYSPSMSGLTMFPRAVICLVGLIVVGEISRFIDSRLLASIGLIIIAISMLMLTQMNTTSSMESIILPNILLCVGVPTAFVPITALSFQTLPASKMLMLQLYMHYLKIL